MLEQALTSYHIHINGIVQGVGFRPLVFKVASRMGIPGYVKNGSDGLHVFFNTDEQQAALFFRVITNEAPPRATITSTNIEKIPHRPFNQFQIIVDNEEAGKRVLISPDIALCATCRKELHDHKNRRHQYPFITCTQCGPRYSIINALPYERHLTAMKSFGMCDDCLQEYQTVTNRRFFSQTNSCGKCGIHLLLYNNPGSLVSTDTSFVLACINGYINDGKILAVKGMGGFLLICDAANAEAIRLLRIRKHRPKKPFALLYPDMETAASDYYLSRQESELLLSDAAPIVLLSPKQYLANKLAITAIAPGLNRLGIMLPYTPLLELITANCERPLVATSANIAGSPIIYRDEDAMEYLFGIADHIASYNRDIVIPQDDSVVYFSKIAGQKIMLRRARGYAPSFPGYSPLTPTPLLAMGAHLKNSFTLSVNNNLFISQYLGSAEGYEAQQMYEQTLRHWLKLYQMKPAGVLIDQHPQYFSSRHGENIANQLQADLQAIQHHEAHFTAVLGEHSLVNHSEPVLGVIWDGTGLGSDGNVWGGEFFVYENRKIRRCCHFENFPVIAGDKPAREPRLSALCATYGLPGHEELLKSKFSDTEWNIYQKLLPASRLFSSSVGRLFDAVASLLGLCDRQTYEGEAALYLQVLAEAFVAENGFCNGSSYADETGVPAEIINKEWLLNLLGDVLSGASPGEIAAKFHYTLARLVGLVAEQQDIETICFSGGVFQNSLLVDWMIHLYGETYSLRFHESLSPNDENISFGQLVFADNDLKAGTE